MNDRKLRFTYQGGVRLMEYTDYAVSYPSTFSPPNPNVMGVSLTGTWQQLDTENSPFERRIEKEEFLQTWSALKGQIGTLDVAFQWDSTWLDFGAFTYNRLTLKDVQFNEILNNAVVQYTLVFEWAVNALVARSLQFGADDDEDKVVLNAMNFIVEPGKETDRTSFVPVWQAAPVRIENGPALKTLKITVLQGITPTGTALAMRRACEAAVRNWAWMQKGRARPLKLDADEAFDAHLKDVRVTNLTLPEAVAYELDFVTGYGV